MRIAVCIWGLLRSLRFTIDSFEQHILTVLERHGVEYDIFVHTYNISGAYHSARNHEKSVTLNVSDWQLLHPNYIFIENQDEFDQRINYQLFETQGDPWHNDFSSFRNHMRALNSLYHVTQVVEQMHKLQPYDGIVFVRPDVRFITDLPLQLLFHSPSMAAYDLYLPDFHRSCHGNEYNDRMALGKVAAALTYGKKFESSFAYSLTHKLHAEKITFNQLTEPRQYLSSCRPSTTYADKSVRVAEIPFRFQRIRSSGDIHIRDYEAVTPQRQESLENRGEYFVGKGRRTPYLMRAFYTLLEYLTFGQMYIWNHDDHGNVFCHPFPHLNYKVLQKIEKQVLSNKVSSSNLPSKTQATHQSQKGHGQVPTNSLNRKQGAHRMDCSYRVVAYDFTVDCTPIAASYVKAEACHVVTENSSLGPSVLTRGSPSETENAEDESFVHMPKKIYNHHYNHGKGPGHHHHHNNTTGHMNKHVGTGGTGGTRKYHLRSGMGHFDE